MGRLLAMPSLPRWAPRRRGSNVLVHWSLVSHPGLTLNCFTFRRIAIAPLLLDSHPTFRPNETGRDETRPVEVASPHRRIIIVTTSYSSLPASAYRVARSQHSKHPPSRRGQSTTPSASSNRRACPSSSAPSTVTGTPHLHQLLPAYRSSPHPDD